MPNAFWIVLLIGAMWLGDCQAQRRSTARSELKDSLYLKISRTGCYGRCPIDAVELLPGGKVRYHGIRFVARMGIYERKLSPDEQKEVLSLFQQADFGKYQELYDELGATDLPAVVVEYRHKGFSKRIVCRTGCPDELPKNIEQLRGLLAEKGNFQKIAGSEEEKSPKDE
ncbi:MAG: DUF6438 domain-containing protein [Bacteroidia bacterium]|nr:DUF6438 domain-containing protein [Bacteroidia bacterium]MDW8236217.1 DUF6438 domain-containing protein [Bacteroidia bacterium]